MRSRNRISFFTSAIAAVALALAGCSRLPVYSHFLPVSEQGWARGDSLHFVVPVDSTGTYRLRLDLRTTSHYPYTQLALRVSRQSTGSDAQQADTLHFSITDADGNLQGRGIGVFQHSAQLPPVTLQRSDTLRLSVVHIMSAQQLPGIADVGITVER